MSVPSLEQASWARGTADVVMAPKSLLIMAMLVLIFWLVLVLKWAYQPPWLGVSFESADDGLSVLVKSVDPLGPAAGKLEQGDQINVIWGHDSYAARKLLPADINLEPDSVSTYREYNTFFERQAHWYRLMNEPMLHFSLANRQAEVSIQPGPHRPIASFPLGFWYQLVCGMLTFIAGASVWAFKRRDIVVLYYWLTGIGLLLAASTAAIYSTRELALDAEIFKQLSLTNQFGSFLFSGPFIAVIWCYPTPLGKAYVAPLILMSFFVFWVLNLFQVFDTLDVGMRLPMICGMILVIILAVWQWRRSPKEPLSRAVMKWFLLAWLMGSFLYIGLVTLPLMLGFASVIDQSIAWVILLLVYLGVTAGILKYQLFNVDRWILGFWLWLAGGLLVLLVDALLIFVFDFERLLGFSVALAFSGWVYFPLRQWLWQRFFGRWSGSGQRHLFEQATRNLASLDEKVDMELYWERQLTALFKPIKVRRELRQSPQVKTLDSGMSLTIPSLAEDYALVLVGANEGGRLFNKHDSLFVSSLRLLYSKIYQYEQAVERGERRERKRIARDLHDNVAAKLLSLVYRAENKPYQALAQDGLRQLREVINGLQIENVKLADLLPQWRDEGARRTQEVNMGFRMESDQIDQRVRLSARQALNLRSVFSELLSNSIRHSGATFITVTLQVRNIELEDTLRVSFSDNGCGFVDSSGEETGGLYNIRQRIEELAGVISFLPEMLPETLPEMLPELLPELLSETLSAEPSTTITFSIPLSQRYG